MLWSNHYEVGRNMATGSNAVIDASIVYGASRILRGLHDKPEWPFKDKYNRRDDELLFKEFLHDLLLYERIILDNSSVTVIGSEIIELFTFINTLERAELIQTKSLSHLNSLDPVVKHICRLLQDRLKAGSLTGEAILSMAIPWAYSRNDHYDRTAFAEHFREIGLTDDLIPFAIFAFRGLVYAGFANGIFRHNQQPSTYIASPYRINALVPLLSTNEINNINFPKKAYADLIKELGLPESGYDFSFLNSDASELSDLSLAISEMKPRQALRYVFELRHSEGGERLRSLWAERLWAQSSSSLVGVSTSQNVSHTTVGRDLIQLQFVIGSARQ